MYSSIRNVCYVAVVLGAGVASAMADEVQVTRLSGTVAFLADGKPVVARVGSKLNTPLRITTGSDGSLHIEQPSSSLDIGPNTTMVLPGSTESQSETIVQTVGRVMYSVKPRKRRSFAVETPYLVSVVKGTTFSVAVDETSAAVALLEGSVEVTGPGTDQTILLEPNHSARRAQGERAITVTQIDTASPAADPQARNDRAPLQLIAQSSTNDALALQSSAIANDLNEITAAYADRRVRFEQPIPPPADPATPFPLPSTPGEPSPQPQAPVDTPDEPTPVIAPAPTPAPTPQVPVPSPTPTSPLPLPPTDDNDDDDDGNNGHGNDDDHDDDSNPGRGRGRDRH